MTTGHPHIIDTKQDSRLRIGSHCLILQHHRVLPGRGIRLQHQPSVAVGYHHRSSIVTQCRKPIGTCSGGNRRYLYSSILRLGWNPVSRGSSAWRRRTRSTRARWSQWPAIWKSGKWWACRARLAGGTSQSSGVFPGKWGWAVRGCREILESANRWRLRGERLQWNSCLFFSPEY